MIFPCVYSLLVDTVSIQKLTIETTSKDAAYKFEKT